MAGNRGRNRNKLRRIKDWYNNRENNDVENNDVEKSRKMINHRINGWSNTFEDDQKKRKRMRHLGVIAALLISSSVFFAINSQSSSSSMEAKENVKIEKSESVKKDSTSVKKQSAPKSEVTSPDEEALIDRPEYPKTGFNSTDEVEEFNELLGKYNEQQERITRWKEKGNSVFIMYKDRRYEAYLNSIENNKAAILI